MQQHAQSVHCRVSALTSFREERRLERRVNDVRGYGVFRQLVESNIERALSNHSLAGRVDDHRSAFERIIALLPWQRRQWWPELFCDFFGAIERAVHEPDLTRTFLREPIAHGART